jgi:hypothetical protein
LTWSKRHKIPRISRIHSKSTWYQTIPRCISKVRFSDSYTYSNSSSKRFKVITRIKELFWLQAPRISGTAQILLRSKLLLRPQTAFYNRQIKKIMVNQAWYY